MNESALERVSSESIESESAVGLSGASP